VYRTLILTVLALAACRTAAPEKPAASTSVQTSAVAPPAPLDATAIDRAVSPCDDFYRFACGGWLDRTEIPPDRSTWGRGFSVLGEKNLAQQRALAETAAAGKAEADDRYAGKVGAFYAACMDEQAVEARGLQDLQADWKKVDEVKDARTLGLELARLHKRGVWPAFALASDQDAKDATQVIGVVAQGGLSLPDREYYLADDARSKQIRADYEAHVARMLVLAGTTEAQAKQDAAAILALETRMAQSHWTRVEMRDPQRVYNRVELAGLEKLAPRFPWKEYLQAVGQPSVTTFSTTTPKAVEQLNALVADVPPATWKAYLRWKILSDAARERTVPKRLVDERFAFTSKAFTGQKELQPRWKHCVELTDAALGEALGQHWVRRNFAGDAKQKTVQLVSEVEGAMGRDLGQLAWMDDATRARAKEKLEAVKNKIGYPDSWRKYDALEVDRSSFYKSAAAGSAFEVNRDLTKIGKPLDRGEWLMPPPMVNAYYNPSMNEMVFPAGILQPPFYARPWPDAVNYGAIGMVVGHELTHGFDDQGRQFDAKGNLAEWWTPPVAKEFDRRAECVVKQYSAYDAVEGEGGDKLNGQLTLGENIADLGGLKLAFAAYEASRAGKPPEAAVEGFTPEQAFFVGYAQSWCTKVRPEAARVRAKTDPHSPPRWRVNGPLANTPEFANAFQCGAGKPMVRSERCEVW
jgi:putative endopeptidase